MVNNSNYRPQRLVRKKRSRAWPRLIVFFCTCVMLFGVGRATGSIAQAISNTAFFHSIPAASKNDLPQKVSKKKQHNTPSDDYEWNLILVNPWNKLPDNFSVETTTLANNHSIDKRAYPDLQEMLDAARGQGLSLIVCSSFRTMDKQVSLFNNKVNQYLSRGYSKTDAKAEAGKWVAVPGTSEHQTGLALDIVALSYQLLDEGQENTAEQQWLMANSYKYGFILRYPSNKSDITGIGYEPWHYRYVGKEAAKEIYEKGFCLEEYLTANGDGAEQ